MTTLLILIVLLLSILGTAYYFANKDYKGFTAFVTRALWAAVGLIGVLAFIGFVLFTSLTVAQGLQLVLTLVFVLFGAATVLLMSGRIVAQIPQNAVGAVYRFGQRVNYIVLSEEEMKKLTEDLPDRDGVKVDNPNVKLEKEGILKEAIPIPFVTNLLNIRLYSWNPFDSFKSAEIYKHHWKKPGEWTADQPVKNRISLATEASKEKFLWIDSVIIGYDEGVELNGNLQVNFTRQTNIRVGNLDEIWLVQNGRFSLFVNETISAGHMSFFNAISFDEKTTVEGKTQDSFQKMNFSENSKEFNDQIKSRIGGNFGAIVRTTTVTEWELSKGSEEIVASINRATAAEHNLQAARKDAEGKAAFIVEEGKANAGAAKALLDVLVEKASTPEGQLALNIQLNKNMAESLSRTTGTIVFGKEGVMPTIPLNTSTNKETKTKETTTKED